METFPENLSDQKAKELLLKFGLNELPKKKTENFLVRNSKAFKEPMILLLVAASLVYLIMGDKAEGILLGLSVFVVIGIAFYQERKSEKALEALRELSSPRAMVIRNGIEKRIPATELVPGDLVVLHEGDRVPADGTILESNNLSIDESLLTGESFPAKKSSKGSEQQSKVFSNTLVVSGTAYARVNTTGANTAVGKIGTSLQEVEPEELNLSKEIRVIVRLFAWTGLIICAAIILIYGFTQGDWTKAFLVGLATEMSLLPEEFPVILTIFLAMGAWRLSKVQVLVRKPASIERLGAITVLCVDKTGTLTQNQMTVAKTTGKDTAYYGALASHVDPFDPMEKAIHRAATKIPAQWEFVRDYPLSDQLLAMTCIWKNPESDSLTVATKGAPEVVLKLCKMDQKKSEEILAEVKSLAQEGLRVLGVARTTCSSSSLPENQNQFNLEWVGLIGLEDPLRAEVPAAVDLCRQAGIRIIMMTGDYPETAQKIAEKAGIDTVNSLITGEDLDQLSDEVLKQKLESAHIFARMIPQQKLRIVKLLKEMGHVVGMTGDGVNDAPSLKWASVGIAMGSRGTDVAREASDIVLTDDNFASIVSGIERGRVIFSNIKKAISFIVSVHIPIAGLSIFPALFNLPLILMPIHIVFLELIIDPACTVMFESQATDDKVMKSPPRSLSSKLFTIKDQWRSTLQGAFVLLTSSIIFWYFTKYSEFTPEHARSLTFVVLVLSNIGLIFADMSNGSILLLKRIFHKISNWMILLGITLLLILITYLPALRSLFHFDELTPLEFIGAEFVGIFTFMIISFWNRIAIR